MENSLAPHHLAIDWGLPADAYSPDEFDSGIELEELHRFANGGVHLGKRLVWDLLGQWQHVCEGLRRAAAAGDRIRSIGADTWGVDYVLLDRNDDMVGPVSTIARFVTRGVIDQALQRISRTDFFQATGLQFMEINTAYQLHSMRLEESPLLDIAERFLMVPDFLHWQLTGEKVNEFTNASTTQLLDAQSGDWSSLVLRGLEIPESIFSKPVQPGLNLGHLLPHVRHDTQLHAEVDVIVPATHDTGSAVLAVPANSFAQERPDWCYISCGTWSLLGTELASPVLTEAFPQLHNFTNEGGVHGSVRLLKNIAGLWIVQQCREQWKREGRDLSWDALSRHGSSRTAWRLSHTDAPQFLSPPSMPDAIRDYCRSSGQPVPGSEGEIIRCTSRVWCCGTD